jgi:hypothetical protein
MFTYIYIKGMKKEEKENPYNMKNGKDRKKEIKPG